MKTFQYLFYHFKSTATKFLIGLIKAYQLLISPYLPPSCRYQPSCSSYAIAAITKYGIIRGVYLSFRRLMRCHPLGGNGYDPVP